MRSKKQLDNLKPPFKKGEYTETQKKGTLASARKRKQLKDIRIWAVENLFSKRGQDKKIPLYQMLFKQLEKMCIAGDKGAIQMLFDYSGLRPCDYNIEESKYTERKLENMSLEELSNIFIKKILKDAVQNPNTETSNKALKILQISKEK